MTVPEDRDPAAAYRFELPEGLIAQAPRDRRAASRLLRVDRTGRVAGEHPFAELPSLLEPGDLLVLNDSRVLPARLETRRADTGGRVELLLIAPRSEGTWSAMARPTRRLKPGVRLEILGAPDSERALAATGCHLEITGKDDDGMVEVRGGEEPARLAERWGVMPLPPYIRRDYDDPEHLRRMREDRRRYQTVYAAPATARGASVAAPTAGLHFDDAVLEALRKRGVEVGQVRLHVGPGTFRPPDAGQIRTRRLHPERFHMSADLAGRMRAVRAAGGRVIAVGTTSLRVLETVARLGLNDEGPDERVFPAGDAEFHGWARRRGRDWEVDGTTRLFIMPPDEITAVDGLLTNFHLPGSSLLMLVAAFLQPGDWRGVYEEAVSRRLRFYSYGDCMLVLGGGRR